MQLHRLEDFVVLLESSMTVTMIGEAPIVITNNQMLFARKTLKKSEYLIEMSTATQIPKQPHLITIANLTSPILLEGCIEVLWRSEPSQARNK
jgi:hypothetical protein